MPSVVAQDLWRPGHDPSRLRAGLGDIAAGVAVPATTGTRVTAGIVHLGVGAFHRAHQAMYVDRLLPPGESHVGHLRRRRAAGRPRPSPTCCDEQDGLYTLLTVDPDGATEARVIGSHVAHLHAPDDPQAVVDRLADPATRIVSLTITEGGYGVDDATGEFEPRDPATLADLAGAVRRRPASSVSSWPGCPSAEPPGPRRSRCCPATTSRATGTSPEHAVTSFARRRDPGLADWIARARRVPELDGRPDHPGDDRRDRRRGRRRSASRTAGRSGRSRSPSGCSRTASATADPPSRRRRRAARRRRRCRTS